MSTVTSSEVIGKRKGKIVFCSNPMNSRFRYIISLLLIVGLSPALSGAQPSGKYVPVGLFIASIEEGARIFTPVRLLPFGHPEALTHQFPTVLQLHAGEFDLLVLLGRQAGYGLWATLERYPTQPDSSWPYAGFQKPPADSFRTAAVVRRPASDSPLPGLRAVALLDRAPLAFIVDTRSLTLAQRGMKQATTMGLDITRAQFLDALNRAAAETPSIGPAIVVFR